MKIKKGDKVKVISGKDKGATGVVLKALPKENKVVVEGVAIYKRHLKGAAGKVALEELAKKEEKVSKKL